MAVTRADGVHFDAKTAGADLSEKVGFLARIDTTSGDLILSGNAELTYGIITEGAVAGKAATVQTHGLGKAVAGAAIPAGVRVMSNADGKAVEISGASAHGIGTARNSVAAEDEMVEIDIDRTRGAA